MPEFVECYCHGMPLAPRYNYRHAKLFWRASICTSTFPGEEIVSLYKHTLVITLHTNIYYLEELNKPTTVMV